MAWQTPKTDWNVDDGVGYADLNRIEGNTLQNHTDIGTLDGDLDDHIGDGTIHETSAVIRAKSNETIRIECRTSDPSSPQNGEIWLRTDL
jgi:hypothetical protein